MASRCLNSDITVYNLYMFAWFPCTLFFAIHVQGILNLLEGSFCLSLKQQGANVMVTKDVSIA